MFCQTVQNYNSKKQYDGEVLSKQD